MLGLDAIESFTQDVYGQDYTFRIIPLRLVVNRLSGDVHVDVARRIVDVCNPGSVRELGRRLGAGFAVAFQHEASLPDPVGGDVEVIHLSDDGGDSSPLPSAGESPAPAP